MVPAQGSVGCWALDTDIAEECGGHGHYTRSLRGQRRLPCGSAAHDSFRYFFAWCLPVFSHFKDKSLGLCGPSGQRSAVPTPSKESPRDGWVGRYRRQYLIIPAPQSGFGWILWGEVSFKISCMRCTCCTLIYSMASAPPPIQSHLQ